MQLGVSEILKNAEDLTDETQKIIYLRQQGIKPVQIVLQYALDPNIEWLLPEGLPEFQPNKVHEGAETMLLAEARRMYLFVKGGNDSLEQRKREILFVQFLEMLCPDDVELIRNVKDKKLPYPSLTYDLIKKAFPALLPDVEAEEETTETVTEPEKVKKPRKPKTASEKVKDAEKKKSTTKKGAKKVVSK